MRGPNQVFTDTLVVDEVDPHGKKFDRVSRIICNSIDEDFQITLDVNTEIYPVTYNDKLLVVLAKSLSRDGMETDGKKRDAWKDTVTGDSLADDYEYVMYGKVYQFDDKGSGGAKA
ncbi:DNA-directed RNA polymerases I, II, and III subunit RPABC3 [Borealophlyctis nickersoniae]|nr:DNA-directed RNA polymerases I, II, and III subunit RPABC3 [Borealophlyctis nickersoniae]